MQPAQLMSSNRGCLQFDQHIEALNYKSTTMSELPGIMYFVQLLGQPRPIGTWTGTGSGPDQDRVLL
jgi:hypothetical protein